ncbi:MAG: PhzF family phenazine biosynthesis protein [Acidobacteria bacterium]|nr:PhzF family phenazine biosynthesis protein [Acidobacteriota bacterium]
MSDPLRVAAFTSDPAGGNMAGVVIGDHGTPSEMMAVAAEVGYSETAFLEPTDDRMVWNTRYFAPQMEVDFCGHATIAAGSILRTQFCAGTYLLRANVGEISVERTLGDDGDVRVHTYIGRTSRSDRSDAALSTALPALGCGTTDLDPAIPTAISSPA